MSLALKIFSGFFILFFFFGGAGGGVLKYNGQCDSMTKNLSRLEGKREEREERDSSSERGDRKRERIEDKKMQPTQTPPAFTKQVNKVEALHANPTDA